MSCAHRIGLFLAVTLLAACSRQPRETASPATADPPPAPPKDSTRQAVTQYHMRLHFHDLADVQRRLLEGDLANAREFAFLLTMQDSDPSMAKWNEFTMAVATAAREVQHAPSIEVALRREVRVALACANCHLATGREPHLAVAPPMPTGSSIDDTMDRHTWAAQRLWEGVITPSDERWTAGLQALVRAPIHYSVDRDEPALAESLQRRALLELQQHDDVTLEHRVTAYGEMLVVCAACHATDRESNSRASE